MKYNIYAILSIMLVVLFVSACTQSAPNTVKVEPQPPVVTTPVEPIVKEPEPVVSPPTIVKPTSKYSGTVLAGTTDPYILYNKEDFDKAVAAGKLVMLYFYNDNNPICKSEEVALKDAFNDFDIDKVVGFRVHIQDSLADNNMLAVAEKYDIDQDHVKLLIKNGVLAEKGVNLWNKNDFEMRIGVQLN